MLASKQEILDRYNKVETPVDKLGRILQIKRLRVSQELAVIRFADSQDSYVQLVSRVAAAVRSIDGVPLEFPRSQADLNATIDLLDSEGIEAAMAGFAKLYNEGKAAAEDGEGDPKPSL